MIYIYIYIIFIIEEFLQISNENDFSLFFMCKDEKLVIILKTNNKNIEINEVRINILNVILNNLAAILNLKVIENTKQIIILQRIDSEV